VDHVVAIEITAEGEATDGAERDVLHSAAAGRYALDAFPGEEIPEPVERLDRERTAGDAVDERARGPPAASIGSAGSRSMKYATSSSAVAP
jgi:hypothetical protein